MKPINDDFVVIVVVVDVVVVVVFWPIGLHFTAQQKENENKYDKEFAAGTTEAVYLEQRNSRKI